MTPTPTATAAVTPTAVRVLVRIPRSPHHATGTGSGAGTERVTDVLPDMADCSSDTGGGAAGREHRLRRPDNRKSSDPEHFPQYPEWARRDDVGDARNIVR